MTAVRSTSGIAYLGAAAAVFVWGATPAATKFAVGEIDPLTAGLLRTVLAGTVALVIVLATRLPLPADRRGWSLLAVSAACSFAAFPLLISLALARTSTAHVALIVASVPVFTGLIGSFVERRRPGGAWWAGVAIAMAGEALLIGLRDRGAVLDETTLSGDLLALAACMVVSAGYVAGSRLTPRIGAWSATFWSLAIAGAVQLPVLALLADRVDWPAVAMAGWYGMAWLVLCSSLLGYVAWYWALAAGGVSRIAPVQFVQPVISLILAVLLFGESMTGPLILSAVAILVGVAIARRG